MAVKTFQLEDSEAKKLYKTASPEFKTILEESFGKKMFYTNIIERIQTIEDVFEVIGKSVSEVLPWSTTSCKTTRSQNAYALLQCITEAYNEGWTPNFNNSYQPKYFLYFTKKPEIGWVVDYYYCYYSDASCGFGLYFETKEKALDAGKKFLNVFIDYLPE